MGKKLFFILISFVIFALSCYLITPANATPRTNTTSESSSDSNSTSDSTSKSSSRSKATGGDAKSRSSSKAKGGKAVSEANGEQSVSVVQEKSDIPPPTANATPGTVNHRGCRYGVGAGTQSSAFGLSLSGSFEDANCEARLNAESFLAIGHPDLALLSMCFIPESRKMLESFTFENGKRVDCSFVDDVKTTNYEVDNSN